MEKQVISGVCREEADGKNYPLPLWYSVLMDLYVCVYILYVCVCGLVSMLGCVYNPHSRVIQFSPSEFLCFMQSTVLSFLLLAIWY